MEADVRNLPDHMREFGLHLMGKAVRDATFSEMCTPYAHAIAVTIAAHAAEIIIKARIAQEHPLLIFSKLPKPAQGTTALLNLRDLLNTGRSLQFSELADVLWAATGYRIPNADQFREFGETRNAIIHCAVPDSDLSALTLEFAFKIVQPMVLEFWRESLLTYCDAYDDDMEIYLMKRLDDLGLTTYFPRISS